VAAHFPEARLVILGGSPIRGDATATSDLDILVLTWGPEAPFRASYREHGWPIEAFVHSEDSLRSFFAADIERRRPSLPNMAAEGVILVDTDGYGPRIQDEARALLAEGPAPLTQEEMEDWRYALTDVLDDFKGVERRGEGIFTAAALAAEASDLLLLQNRRWLGTGKWVPRALARFDPAVARRVAGVLDAYYRSDDREPLIRFAEEVLEAAGGRMFEGYYRQAPR
jgi:predicted nucleotidyltransferase